MINLLKKEFSFNLDFLITLINATATIVGIFLLNAYIARSFGLDVLGEYLLIRRTVFSGISITLIGMNIGLPYFIAKGDTHSFGKSAFLLFFTISIPLLLILYSLIHFNIINVFLPDLILPILIYAISANMLNLTIGLFRGYINILAASIISIIGTVVIPFVLFLIYSELSTILTLTGIIVSLFSIFLYIYRDSSIVFEKINISELVMLSRFGMERLVSFISQFFLLAGIPLLLYSEISKNTLAYLNSSISLVRLGLIVIGPFGFIILPRVSKFIKNSKNTELIQNVSVIISWSVLIGVLGMLLFLFFGPLIIKYWLGEISLEGIYIGRYISFCIPFFIIANMLRSIIDASSERGYNSFVYLISAISILLVYYIFKYLDISPLKAGLWGFNTGYIIAGIFSILTIQKIFNIKIVNKGIYFIVFFETIGSLALFILLKQLIYQPLTQLIIYMIVTIFGLLIFFKYSKLEWVEFVRNKIT